VKLENKIKQLKQNKMEKIIKATPNHSARTFTIRCTDKLPSGAMYTTKWRTYPMSKQEFQSSLNNTTNDWKCFFKSNDYYKVK